jgi:DNA adenine methylase
MKFPPTMPLPGQRSFPFLERDGPADENRPRKQPPASGGQIAPRKLRSPLKTHGGKSYLARRIIALFPSHDIYVEPFAGGLNVLINKLRVPTEIANDLNGDIAKFWRVVRDHGDELSCWLKDLSYNDDVFQHAKEMMESPTWADDVYRAVNFMVRNRFSRGGLGEDFAWSKRLRGGLPGDENSWHTIKTELPRVVERLTNVELRCQDALEVIEEFDGPDTLIYADPPYLHETRTCKDAYRFEMSRDDHVRLLVTILGCRGMVALSGYGNPLYDDALRGWRRVEFDLPNHSSQSKAKERRVEVLWVNR